MANRWNMRPVNATLYKSLQEANEVAATIVDDPRWDTDIIETDAGFYIQRESLEHPNYHLYFKQGTPKVKPVVLPEHLWTIAYHTHNALGSITHVGTGERFYATKEGAQAAIDALEGWPGWGGRDKYKPLLLVRD